MSENSVKTVKINTELTNVKLDNKMGNNKNNSSSEENKRKVTSGSGDSHIKVKSAIPRKRQELLKWYGWGYNDSYFKIDTRDNKGVVTFTGDRYLIGGKTLPHFASWVKEKFDVDLLEQPRVPDVPPSFPDTRLPDHVYEELGRISGTSRDGMDRYIRAHGQTLREMAYTRTNGFKRIPDAVVWPKTHDEVVEIVNLAGKHHFVIIPFGGGTSVSCAVLCPENEERPIVVLDTSDMNSILWLDKDTLLARVQAGIVGQDLEREMRSRGCTVGHEPDSYEFSTLGGWVATRASGMKKNTYGNIEDIVVQTKVVTARGVIERSCRVPRLSCGPDWEHVILGSEGCLGVVTEVTLKIRPLPPIVRYGSLVFPDFDSGFHFVREVARHRLQPASIRLIDNEQFLFGHALKAEASWASNLVDGLKKMYLTKLKGFDLKKLCAVTLLIEGTLEEVTDREKKLNTIAAKYGGIPGGAKNGEIGYTLTFVIAYLRDVAIDFNIVGESFETSVSWERAPLLCRNTVRRIRDECARRRLTHYLVSHRLTQTYDAGCCIYFYFAMKCIDANAVKIYEEIEEAARDEIVACGGSISHHHGVGKHRKKWYKGTVSEPGRMLLLSAKRTLDPDNIFALGNMDFDEYKVQSKL
ncbi:alkyldihydroxyacetonephosphate synthase [Aricia agestis]|uniref:alkyldihydroxyacetonephosphate synthase n=1 Tax=Aricia agestis TaxID=91739 RepID=UPI001C20BDAE|nr:alkyldihydroxyacetonephosphate synthase [Aricia agestis]